MTEINSGIETRGGDIDWRSINNNKNTDFALETLFREAKKLFFDTESIYPQATVKDNNIFNYLTSFNSHISALNTKKFSFSFTIPVVIENNVKSDKKTKKSAVKPVSKADLIRQQNDLNKNKAILDSFIKSLMIKDHNPSLNSTNIESFLCIVNWAFYLILKKKDNTIENDIYFNCAISLYRSLDHILSFIQIKSDENDENKLLYISLKESLRIETLDLIGSVQDIFHEKTGNDIYDFLLKNTGYVLDSFWDKVKPVKVSLYEEQKDILSLVGSNLDKKLLVFFEMPPANGKTVLSTILAKLIASKNDFYSKKNPSYKKKTILYICYNSIVRDEVARLCVTHNVDITFWMAVTRTDGQDGKIKTFLRPYQNCYKNWNQRHLRTKKEESNYHKSKVSKWSENLHEQWSFFMNETRPIVDQDWKQYLDQIESNQFDYVDDNLPEMVIADLESAYALLKEFPDTFVTYFDETFALSNLKITSQIMSVMGLSVFVSATLAKPEEIPTVIADFKHRYHHTDDSFLHMIRSTKQQIGCTFIDDTGYIYPAHKNIKTIEELSEFITKIEKIPLIQRSYSPEVVFHMVKLIEKEIDESMKFRSRFNYYGKMTHADLRKYAFDVLQFIAETKNDRLLTLLTTMSVKKIKNMDVQTLFTESAINYQRDKFLHVSTDSTFDSHVNSITEVFLKGSPKTDNIVSRYDQQLSVIQKQIASTEKAGGKDVDYTLSELQKELGNIALDFPKEFIFNSTAHASKFGNAQNLKNPNKISFVKRGDLGFLEETREKLLFSGIGIYQPETFSFDQMQNFLEKKDLFNGILSNSAIVYGTNISLSVVDIDGSFIRDSTKNVLYQLVGRAGRIGKSSSATIVFRSNDILNMIMHEENVNKEASQVEQHYLDVMNHN